MAGLLDALINQYGNSASNPYATPQPAVAAAPSGGAQVPSVPVSTLIDMLGKSANNPYANINASSGLNPSIVQISPEEAARAQAQQAPNVGSYQMPSAAATGARQGVSDPMPAMQAPTNGQASGPALQAANVPYNSVAQVSAQSGFPSASDYNADGTQAAPGADASVSQPATGGLLGSLAGAASDAVTDPGKSKGLLGALGDTLSDVGGKLKNMSPAASQGLIAAGMTMLSNNDGRHNLAQLVGDGGVAGINAYQQVNQNRILAAKNLIDMQHMQNQDAVANSNAAVEQYKATHPVVSAGQTVLGPNGQGGLGSIGSGGTKAAGTADQVQPDGSTITYKTDESGQIIPGTGTVSKNPNVGPLNPDQLKVVNTASEQSAKDQAALTRTQAMLTQLQGVDIPAGLKAKGQDLWTQLTGDQTTGQVLRNQLQQQTYQNYLATWKPGIGGRLTNTDVGLLKQGMPPDTASSATWTKFLTSYGKLQGDVADQSTRAAAFAAQNRGDLGTLHAPMTVGGVQYPAGTPYQQVVMGQGGTAAQQSGQNGASNSALLAEAQRRGLKQNANGQWVVSQ